MSSDAALTEIVELVEQLAGRLTSRSDRDDSCPKQMRALHQACATILQTLAGNDGEPAAPLLVRFGSLRPAR